MDSVSLKTFPLTPLGVETNPGSVITYKYSLINFRKARCQLSAQPLFYFMIKFPKHGCCGIKTGGKNHLMVMFLFHTAANMASILCFGAVCVSFGNYLLLIHKQHQRISPVSSGKPKWIIAEPDHFPEVTGVNCRRKETVSSCCLILELMKPVHNFIVLSDSLSTGIDCLERPWSVFLEIFTSSLSIILCNSL